MSPVVEVNEASFKSEVLDSTQPVLVFFRAGQHGPDVALASILEEIARENRSRVRIAKVDVDRNPALASHYHIQSIPTLLYFVNGLVHDHLVGVAGKKEIVAKLKTVVAL